MESTYKFPTIFSVALLIIAAAILPSSSLGTARRFQFNIQWKKLTRLCFTKQLLTVNGEYPGPTIVVNEGESVEIKVTNGIAKNTTIHWHGVRQMRTAWADGPAYVTQCPISGGQSYTYKFQVANQRGTLLWHAHYSWQRASVYGAFIIHPRMPYPFSTPLEAEILILLGEWWNANPEDVERKMLLSGAGPERGLAYTINGMPGPLYPCSKKDTFIKAVEYGKTYLLRIINAVLVEELFFAIENHTLTVVEVDAVYTKPFTTKAILITPGQTVTALLTTNQVPNSTSTFTIAARPYMITAFPFNNSTTVGSLAYKIGNKKVRTQLVSNNFNLDNLPGMEDARFATEFSNKVRSLASLEYPCNVPQTIDRRVITTISLNLQDCPANKTCLGYKGKSFFASMNNQSFVRPALSILESHYNHLRFGTFLSSKFPEKPPTIFNYTGGDPVTQNMNTEFGSKLLVVPYDTKLEIVLQGTSFLEAEDHPIHVHGHNFFIVGSGIGDFDESRDPDIYNLVDPPERNTVAVPIRGWVAIRIKADNPGVWFIHCHLDHHSSWGLAMVLVVQNGPLPSQSLLPPPLDLPSC